MGVNIHLKPSEVWPFFVANKARLGKEMVAIAENEETEYSVYLTEDKGSPQLSVYKQNSKQYEEPAISELDCADTAKRIYLKYLFPVVISTPDYDGNDDDEVPDLTPDEEIQNCEDTIYEREDELVFAMQDFLAVLLSCKDPTQVSELYGEEIIDELLETFCRLLADEYMISVYRPSWVKESDGSESFVEYPYLDVDDEDSNDVTDVIQ